MKTMHIEIPDDGAVRVHLRPFQLLVAPKSGVHSLECLRGGAWLTFAGDRTDYYLAPGERVAIDGRRGALVQAMEESEVALFPPPVSATPAGVLNRLQAWLAAAHRADARTSGAQWSARSATECWRNVVTAFSSARLGLERTY